MSKKHLSEEELSSEWPYLTRKQASLDPLPHSKRALPTAVQHAVTSRSLQYPLSGCLLGFFGGEMHWLGQH